MADEKNPQVPAPQGNQAPQDGASKIDLDAQLLNELNSKSPQPSSNSGAPAASTSSAADPFERLSRKKVARPQAMQMAGGQVKKGSKLSPKMFLIGCGIFFLLFLWLVYAALFYAISSSDFLQTIGLAIEDVKTILMIFALLFFGIVFFLGFYVLVLNVYRLATTKNVRKLKYILWLVWGILIIATTIVLGTLSITKIRSLAATSKIQTNSLVVAYLMTRDGLERAGQPGTPLIAPLKVKHQLNKEQFDRNILPAIGGANAVISSIELDCGNGQKLAGSPTMSLSAGGWYFPDHCLYIHKGSYPMKLNISYTTKQTNEPQTRSFDIGDFPVEAEIQFKPTDGEPYLNDKKTELVIGVNPVTVEYKAQLLFTDLGLQDDKILWDLDGDKTVDLEDNSAFSFTYNDSKLQTINYQLPGLPSGRGSKRLSFDLRVVESELARCDLQVTSVDNDRKYTLKPVFDEAINAASFKYEITDLLEDKLVDSITSTKNETTFTFPNGGQYEISTAYFTQDGQKGACNVEPLTVGFDGNQVDFDLKFAEEATDPFIAVDDTTKVTLDQKNSLINVAMLPAVLEFTINKIRPDPTATLKVYYAGRQIFADSPNVYDVNIGTLGEQPLDFVITTAQGKETHQPYTVRTSRTSVKAMIEVSEAVWTDPFEVTLDASISPLYDENDEIVYFSWDFGDGETRTNVSQWKIDHIYKFNEDKQSGEYYPSVTVRTKLGFEDTYRVTTPIVVKRAQRDATIAIPSHPTQQAKVGEPVTFTVETDGAVNSIARDFGNTKWVSGDGRTYSQVSVSYDQPGTYTIRVEVDYANNIPAVDNITLRVFE